MAYRTLESVLHPDSHLALPAEELPQRPVRVMVTILEDDETHDQTEHLNINPEHREWMNEQIREALESDPADDIPVTPQFWEDWRKELEDKIAKGVAK